MFRFLFIWIYKLSGWKIEGQLSLGLKKCVIIIAPHTSSWDFFLGVSARTIGRFKANYLVKKELFKYPIVGWFLRATGGIPIDRQSKKSNIVEQIVAEFNLRDQLILALTPEGTRQKVTEWKTGFYRIAHQAHVPIVLVSFDFQKKLIKYMEEFVPTGDLDRDMVYIVNQYKGVIGKYPELGVN